MEFVETGLQNGKTLMLLPGTACNSNLNVLVNRLQITGPFDEPDLIFHALFPFLPVEFLPGQERFLSAEKFDRMIMRDSLVLDRCAEQR